MKKLNYLNKLQNLKFLPTISWKLQLFLLGYMLLASGTLWVTNGLFTDRFTQSIRNKAELRLASYGNNLLSELQRNSIVPQLLAMDPKLIKALNSQDFSHSTHRLISFVEEIGSASLMLLDRDGRTVASTDRNNLGSLHREKPFFVDALRSNETVFTIRRLNSGGSKFFYSRRVAFQNKTIGVVLTEVDLNKFERIWAGIAEAVMVFDSSGKVILSTDPQWRGLTEKEALERQPAKTAIEQAMRLTESWRNFGVDTYLHGEAVMRLKGRIPFRGWQISSYTTYSSVREKVNGILALEIMGFALLIAGIFYLASRRATLRLRLFENESAELRRLNERLKREMAEREKVQKTLEVAEQSLAQSSKLAALGEMSAAVSHELNQPLAAMKTYLAGASLLIKRNRSEETHSAFKRIDDLIERMGAITKQLKSYARKGNQNFCPVDMIDALSSSLSMMEPQLKHSNIRLEQVVSEKNIVVMGDRVRIEQVLINLLRNAHDAVKSVEHPKIEILLSRAKTVTLSVRDNGVGIKNLDELFEPFHTTKNPGEGVGLGLAISSGIVKELGGRLTARNSVHGGAVFEMQLPLFNELKMDQSPIEAAE